MRNKERGGAEKMEANSRGHVIADGDERGERRAGVDEVGEGVQVMGGGVVEQRCHQLRHGSHAQQHHAPLHFHRHSLCLSASHQGN